MRLVLAAAGLMLTACGPVGLNPPDEPAAPITTPEAMRIVEGRNHSSYRNLGAKTFVGVWARADQWCEYPRGAESPVLLSIDRIETHDRGCDIVRIQEGAGGYNLDLKCRKDAAPDQEYQERVHVAVTGKVMSLVRLGDEGTTLRLARCPATVTPGQSESNYWQAIRQIREIRRMPTVETE